MWKAVLEAHRVIVIETALGSVRLSQVPSLTGSFFRIGVSILAIGALLLSFQTSLARRVA